MGNLFRYYTFLAKRWMWMFVLCALICSGATYLISSFLRPVYQASAYLIIDVGASAHPSISDSLQAVPTFAQLITIPTVLEPVVAQHPDLNAQDLRAMMAVKPQTNTQIIELDMQAANPQLAADLANQVSQSFARYANTNTPGTVQIIPASPPAFPAQPRPLQAAGIGALVGLVLAMLLSLLFEWISNRPSSVEQMQKLLGLEILALLPRFSHRSRRAAVEKYRMLCASLDVARAGHPFKQVMFTSALAGEGTSTVASNVAIHLAQAGKQVLLVDLNIHRPTLAREFHLSERTGLTDVLTHSGPFLSVEYYAQKTAVPGLSILLSGTQKINSAELLRLVTTGQLFAQLQQSTFDYVLLDVPPLLAVAEAQVLAASAEALVLVVDGARTPCNALGKVRQLLWRLQTTRVLGVVVNKSSWNDFADMRPYAPSQLAYEARSAQPVAEEITHELPAVTVVELPTAAMKLIPASFAEHSLVRQTLPDTGESERVGPPFSERIIRPGLSLSGLSISGNGLIRRTFNGGTIPSTPEPL